MTGLFEGMFAAGKSVGRVVSRSVRQHDSRGNLPTLSNLRCLTFGSSLVVQCYSGVGYSSWSGVGWGGQSRAARERAKSKEPPPEIDKTNIIFLYTR